MINCELTEELLEAAHGRAPVDREQFEQLLQDARAFMSEEEGCKAYPEPCEWVQEGRTRECQGCMDCCDCEPDEDGDILDCECQLDNPCEWVQERDTRTCDDCGECSRYCSEEDTSDFEFLGSGVYHLVYRHIETGLVVKFGGIKTDMDGASYQYAVNCMEHHALKYVPAIYHVEEDIYQDRYFAVTKLYEGYWQSDDNPSATLMIRAIHMGRNGHASTDITEDTLGYDSAKHEYRRMHAMSPSELTQYLHDCVMYAHMLPPRGSLDLHDQNYMVDPDTKELVITDPLC